MGAKHLVDWRISDEFVSYPEAVAEMETRVQAIIAGEAPEQVWLLEHPPLYTAGTSARDGDLLAPGRFPVYATGRGGQYTYHGPGQRIAYVMLDLNQRGQDLRRYVHDLEEWVIRSLDRLNIRGERRQGRVGIWVADHGREDKIAALGVRVRRWVTFHGIALNVDPDLSHFDGIVPCGIKATQAEPFGVTSLAKLGHLISLPEVDVILKETFHEVFG
ncbi:MAG TPA: lipoyl(octanoyl) transferase LipB [Terriglobia bacterium]|nr:lipoyl(octanoyl) transferase LipB [Terriglobia bacterium]